MPNSRKIILACDLDRTVLPDGPHPISDGAMDGFRKIIRNFSLAYVTGRSLDSMLSALMDYKAPSPDVAICDVGTSIYFKKNEQYELYTKWKIKVEKDWGNASANQIIKALFSLKDLKLQEDKNQGPYKVSFYLSEDANIEKIKKEISEKLLNIGIKYEVLITANYVDHFCYLDILPRSISKERALQFLLKLMGLNIENLIYAGDSGNDIDPLTMGCKAIVVNNASTTFKEEIVQVAKNKKVKHMIYFAKGKYKGMNGNYVAGILEGLDYFGYI